MMATHPEASVPEQGAAWADVKGAYRFLSNDRVDPRAIGATHRQSTRSCCVGEAVVLCVQDGTDLQSVKVAADTWVQHTTLAVRESGDLLGMLDQRWYERVSTPAGETRKQRASRWRESDVWIEAAEAIGAPAGAPGIPGARFVHVCDRAADDLRFFNACAHTGVGFVVRARHDRWIDGGAGKLWAHTLRRPVLGELTVTVGTQRDRLGRITRRGREARVAVRSVAVRLDEPANPSGAGAAQAVTAVHLRELDPPADVEAIDWMLLTDEAVSGFDAAARVIGWYQRRWVIEEWHRALKEGCRLERSQLADASGLQRLAAVLGVVAVRLVQLRDLADAEHSPGTADDPRALGRTTPPLWIGVVAALARVDPADLTPRTFWRTIARRGGWLARKHDPRPGWKVIWRGYRDIATMIRGIELMQPPTPRENCG